MMMQITQKVNVTDVEEESPNDSNIINTSSPKKLDVINPKNTGNNFLNTSRYPETFSDSDSDVDVIDREPAVAISDMHSLLILNNKTPNPRKSHKIIKTQSHCVVCGL